MYNFFVNQKSKKKSIYQVLKSIPNVGDRKVKFICKSIGLLKSTSIDSITEPQLKSLSKWIESSFKGNHSVGFAFFQNRKSHIQSLKKMGHVKGERLKNKLPVRRQRTHTNAKTCKRVSFLY
jgi:small subunit ribosomal protein S13